MGQDRDVGASGFTQALHRGRGLRHLQEGEHALLHARTTAGGDRNQRQATVARAFRDAHQLLADDDTHTPAKESEIEGRDGDLVTVKPSEARDERVRLAGLGLQGQQSLSVGGLVHEAKRVGRCQLRVLFAKAVLIDEPENCGSSRLAMVIAANAADSKLVRRFVACDRRSASGARCPAETLPRRVWAARQVLAAKRPKDRSTRYSFRLHGHRRTPTVD